jgi:hypothetical protein
VASTAWSGLELTIHILDVGTTDDEDVNAGIAESLDALPSACGVGSAVWHHGAIPVTDKGFIGLG